MFVYPILALATASLASASAYDEMLNELITNNFKTGESDGDFFYDVPEMEELTKRDDDAMSQLGDVLSNLPELSVHSYDNAEALATLAEMASSAYQVGNYGDFFYLWEVMYHNGYADQVNDLSSGEMKSELEKRFKKLDNAVTILAESSTNSKIAKLYRETKETPDIYSLAKRDWTQCNEDNVPTPNDCKKLKEKLRFNWFDKKTRSKCHKTCCVSWSQVINVHALWVQSKVNWCKQQCIDHGRSCMIHDMDFDNKHFNFCCGSTVGCSP